MLGVGVLMNSYQPEATQNISTQHLNGQWFVGQWVEGGLCSLSG